MINFSAMVAKRPDRGGATQSVGTIITFRHVTLIWPRTTRFKGNQMSIFEKAKEISDKVVDKTVQFSSDELIAETIVKAVEKQESVNNILKEKGSNYRINEIDLQMGIPPTVSFGIQRINDGQEEPESMSNSESQTESFEA